MNYPSLVKSTPKQRLFFSRLIRPSGELGIIHSIFSSIYSSTGLALLVLGILLWIVCPILGLIPLLIYGQASLSNKIFQGKSPKTNLLLVVVVIFTTTAYCTSISHYLDTEVNMSLFDVVSSRPNFEAPTEGIEPISFILPYYLSLGEVRSGLWFLFIQSLTINTVFTLYSILIFPEIAPLIIFINVTGNSYLFHLMPMRQFYSLIFIVPALHTSKLWLKIGLSLLAFQTHSSSVIFTIPIFLSLPLNRISSLTKIRKLFKTFVIFILFLAFPFINYLFYYVVSSIDTFESYSYAIGSTHKYGGLQRLYSYLSISPSLILFWYTLESFHQKIRSSNYIAWFLSFLILSFFTVYTILSEFIISGFLAIGIRMSMYLRFLPGFFMYSFFMSGLLRSGVKRLMPAYVLLFYILLQTANFIYIMVRTQQIGESAVGKAYNVVFWNGYPLSANLYDYFILIKEALFS